MIEVKKEMNTQTKLKTMAGLETVVAGLLVASIFLLGLESAEAYRLHELLGVFLALFMTTYGIYKMRELT